MRLSAENRYGVKVDPTVPDDGTTKSVIITPAAGNRFFRLKWP